MDYSKMQQDIENYVTEVFQSQKNNEFPYHNLQHTQYVVDHSAEIAQYYLLNEEEIFIIKTAAWFHDIGHLYSEMGGHEQTGIFIMRDFVQRIGATDDIVLKVSACIMATKYPQHPRSLPEEIICDADTFHFGTPCFKKTDALVKNEMELRMRKTIKNWHEGSLKLLQQHRFYTGYCQQLLQAGKLENINWLMSLKD